MQYVEMRGTDPYGPEVAKEIVSEMFQFNGTFARHHSNLLQRHYRDMVATAQHDLMNHTGYASHGHMRLGMAEVHPLASHFRNKAN